MRISELNRAFEGNIRKSEFSSVLCSPFCFAYVEIYFAIYSSATQDSEFLGADSHSCLRCSSVNSSLAGARKV